MDDAGNTNTSVQPNADAIAEVKILTASYSAQFGGRSGAMVNFPQALTHLALISAATYLDRKLEGVKETWA